MCHNSGRRVSAPLATGQGERGYSVRFTLGIQASRLPINSHALSSWQAVRIAPGAQIQNADANASAIHPSLHQQQTVPSSLKKYAFSNPARLSSPPRFCFARTGRARRTSHVVLGADTECRRRRGRLSICLWLSCPTRPQRAWHADDRTPWAAYCPIYSWLFHVNPILRCQLAGTHGLTHPPSSPHPARTSQVRHKGPRHVDHPLSVLRPPAGYVT